MDYSVDIGLWRVLTVVKKQIEEIGQGSVEIEDAKGTEDTDIGVDIHRGNEVGP